jgi:acetyl esterase/lipase
LVVLAALAYSAYQLSPWPSALFYRVLMNRGGEALALALEKHVPTDVVAVLDQRYDLRDPDAVLDIFYPANVHRALPTIVWIHGGGFLSGTKSHVANYLKIVAAKGYTAVGVEYSIAPASKYPTPVRQANAALGYLAQNGQSLRVDPSRFILAGDSAGAQIAAQLANIISVPSYARAVGIEPSISRAQLRGVVLHCGVYDLALANKEGRFSHFVKTAIWSYGGRKGDGSHMPEFSVLRYVTSDFPPAFISAGNADPLLPQSSAMAEALTKQGVHVDPLFFPEDYRRGLPHEYQFNLDVEAGREALARLLAFLANR